LVATALGGVDWDDPKSWPTPMEILREVGYLIGSLEDAVMTAFAGAGIYLVSFVACLRSWWMIPFALAGFLIQLLWMLRAMSEEDEEPWLLAAVVPVVAWQVWSCGFWFQGGELVIPIAFLVSFTICWITAFVIRGWMRHRDLSFWDWIDTRRVQFDPAFFRWRPVSNPPVAPGVEAVEPPATSPHTPASEPDCRLTRPPSTGQDPPLPGC